MAWVTTQFGRLFLCFRFGSGAEKTALCREPLHVAASREAKAEAKRLAAKLQLEIDARTFDYAAWFPTSSRLRKLGLKPRELPTLASFTQETWLPLKTLAVRRSTRAYYQDVYSALLAKSELANCRLNELSLEDIDRWRLWIDSRRTAAGDKLSARRKNMARDVLCQILELARQHYRIDDLTLGLRVFRDADEADGEGSDSDDEIHPFAPDEVERIVEAAEGWEKSLVALYFFTGLRRGEGLGLTWNNVFPDDGHLIVTHSVGRYGRTKPKTTASRRKVQFGPRVRAELLAQRRRVELSSAYVFPNQAGSALNQRWLAQELWRRVVERAGVQYRPIGQTRHTYAVMMLQRGAPLAWLQRQMGHTTLQMLIRHYWRYMQAHDLRADEMSRLERAAGATVGEASPKILI
jgi:integrase